jgi:hypothetical protein
LLARSNPDRSPLYDVRNPACRILVRMAACEVMFSRTMYLTWLRRSSISSGGARRDRTDDLMLAKHALSQLSYGPVTKTNAFTSVVELHLVETHSIKVVGLGRLELPTSRLSSARSNQLSYKPLTRGAHARAGMAPMPRTSASPWRVFVREERETKTAKSRQWSSAIPRLLAPECF